MNTDGWTRQADGTVLVQCATPFPGASPEMFDWWFWWHQVDSDRYRMWYPGAHIAVRARYPERLSQPGLSHRERYVGNDSFVTEYIGPRLERLRIRFRPQTEFSIPDAETAICAWVSLSRLPVRFARMVHRVREVEGGCELHSRFEIGVGLPRLLRWLALPRNVGEDLYEHCRTEYARLATMLPELFQEHNPEGRGRSELLR